MTDIILVADVSSANAPGAAPGRASLQDDLDWLWMAAQGVRGVYTEGCIGNDGPNPDRATLSADIASAGLALGWYDFTYPIGLQNDSTHTARDAIGQARMHAASHPKWAPGMLQNAYDFEWPSPADFIRWGCTWPQIANWARAYIAERRQIEGRAGDAFYSYKSWLYSLMDEGSFDLDDEIALWVAGDYAWSTSDDRKPILWQRTGHELMVPTTSGRPPVKTDCSIFLGDETAWASFLGLPPSATPTRPDLPAA
jgi:hypothetical protein